MKRFVRKLGEKVKNLKHKFVLLIFMMMLKNKKKDKVKENILKLLKKSERPMSTQDISLKLNNPWHSIQTRCLMLQIDNKVLGFRVGRINLWQIKS